MAYYNANGPNSAKIRAGIDVSDAEITHLPSRKGTVEVKTVRFGKHKGSQIPSPIARTSGKARPGASLRKRGRR